MVPPPSARFSVHVAMHPRVLRNALPVMQLGHLPAKTYWVEGKFAFVAFSIVLSGAGRLWVGGDSYDVRAPCVICEYPGPHFRYGPHGSWDEVFINYDATYLPLLERTGLVRPNRFLWPIRSVGRIRQMVGELGELARELETPGVLDRIDRLSEWIVAETLLHEGRPEVDAARARLMQVRAFLEEHFTERIELGHVAREFGYSLTTLRRHWAKHVPESPARFVNGLRIQRACRLLCESTTPIAQIARQLGFDDPLYFSKAFHRHTGSAPREYRQKYAGGRTPDGV